MIRGRVPISIDTYKAEVARRALGRGAAIVNDVSALAYEPALAGVVASHGAGLILMHHRGRSDDMYARATYGDVARDVATELAGRVETARTAGVPGERIVLDPGLEPQIMAQFSPDGHPQ